MAELPEDADVEVTILDVADDGLPIVNRRRLYGRLRVTPGGPRLVGRQTVTRYVDADGTPQPVVGNVHLLQSAGQVELPADDHLDLDFAFTARTGSCTIQAGVVVDGRLGWSAPLTVEVAPAETTYPRWREVPEYRRRLVRPGLRRARPLELDPGRSFRLRLDSSFVHDRWQEAHDSIQRGRELHGLPDHEPYLNLGLAAAHGQLETIQVRLSDGDEPYTSSGAAELVATDEYGVRAERRGLLEPGTDLVARVGPHGPELRWVRVGEVLGPAPHPSRFVEAFRRRREALLRADTLAAEVAEVQPASVDDVRLHPDGRTLRVTGTYGPDGRLADVQLTESDDVVDVLVWTGRDAGVVDREREFFRQNPGGSFMRQLPGVGWRYDVELTRPLGDRPVHADWGGTAG